MALLIDGKCHEEILVTTELTKGCERTKECQVRPGKDSNALCRVLLAGV